MKNYTIIETSTGIGMCSLCAFIGPAPYKYGNYCANKDDYYVVNMWAENIEHLVKTKILDDKMKCLLVDKYIYIVDERVPYEYLNDRLCLTGSYGYGNATSNDIIECVKDYLK